MRLQDDPRLLVFSVGGGAGKKDVEDLVARGTRNIVSLPYQPLPQLHQLLSAADVHVVAIGNDMVGVVHPCKAYGAMAVHRPLLLLGPAHCHIGDLITQHRIGWRVEHGDTLGAEQVLKEILATPAAELQAMSERAAQGIAHGRSNAGLMQQLGVRKPLTRKYRLNRGPRQPSGRAPPKRGADQPSRSLRRTIQFPMTSTSIFVRKKQSKASSGLHTTGSFSLNDVFNTIGTPVKSLKALISPW